MKFASIEDIEDYEQEKLIGNWLEKAQNIKGEFDFKYRTARTGKVKSSRVRATFSLDQKITNDTTGTYADIIAGSDGRDVLYRERYFEPDLELNELVFSVLKNEELASWALQTLKSWIQKNETLFQISLIDLESWKPFEPFSE